MDHNKSDAKLFAPVPFRAFADSRLRGAHFQLLGAVAMHDRMGASGHGCTASHRRIAQITGLHLTTVTKGIGELIILGYVLAEKSKRDGRRRICHIIYNADDFVAFALNADVKSVAGKPGSVAEREEFGGRRVRLRDWKCSDSPGAIYSKIENTINKGRAVPEQSNDKCATASNPSQERWEDSEEESPTVQTRDAFRLVKLAANNRLAPPDKATAAIDRANHTASLSVADQSQNKNLAGAEAAKPSPALLNSRLCRRARGEE